MAIAGGHYDAVRGVQPGAPGEGGSATSTTTFAVVGLTEGFDESLILLRRTFGWSKLHYPPANFSLRRGGRPVPRSVLERIEALNWLDADLYEYAQRRMQQAIDAAAQFDADLRRFRRSNSLYRRTWGAVTYTLGPRPY